MGNKTAGLGIVLGLFAVLAFLTIVSGAACVDSFNLTTTNQSCGSTSVNYLNLTINNSHATKNLYLEFNVTTNQTAGNRSNISIIANMTPLTVIGLNITAYEYINGTITFSLQTNMTAPWNLSLELPNTNLSTCSWTLGNTNDTLRVTNYSTNQTTCLAYLQRHVGTTGTASFHSAGGITDFGELPTLIIGSLAAATGAGIVIIYTLKRRSSA